jgi:hypothetical protein
MAYTNPRQFKSKYSGVRGFSTNTNCMKYSVNIMGVSNTIFKTEREAAIAVDMYYINKGKPPKNILKQVL